MAAATKAGIGLPHNWTHSDGLADVPPEILPWLAKICPKTGLPIPPPLAGYSVATSPGYHDAQSLGDVPSSDGNPQSGLQCTKCAGSLLLGPTEICACIVTTPQAQPTRATNYLTLRSSGGHLDSVSLHQNPQTLEQIQLPENTYSQLHHDNVGASNNTEANYPNILGPAPILDSVGDAHLLSLLNASEHPNLNLTNHLHLQSEAQTHNGPNFTSNRSLPSTDISPTAFQALSSTHETEQPLLHVATQNGHFNIIQMLIDHKVDINKRDSSGRTALHIAVDNRCHAAIRLLLQHGADIHATDREDHSPLFLAVKIGFEDAVKLFLARGANN